MRDESTIPSPIRSLKDSLLSSYFNNAVVKGPNAALEPSELRYDSQWLESLSTIIQDKWCKLHKLFAEPATTFNIFDIMTWLSTMAFQKSVNTDAILALGTLFKRPELATQLLPVVNSGRARKIKHLVLISPYEANHLLPVIEKSKKVTLHLFASRHNSGFASLDKLELWNVGKKFSTSSLAQDLKLQLNLFSGSLYFDSYQEYSHFCDALGLLRTTPTAEQQVSACGFIKPPTSTWGLDNSLVPFLQSLVLKIRREGDGIEKTHLGKVLNALPLKESDFEQGPGRPRGIAPEMVAEFEQHTGSRRSRPFDPEDPESLFMPE
ncbi:hypothetical protein E8E12_009566 [Didymella heteroderae]|uniref:Uncharacterized protein n=1 Tax=Didymella heteroderae TaxID=1769908 RepID=A0A9P4WUU8_9PLEO|nr:hypothetical protein E8E12_009566 [Didymella heteroderae]